MNNQELFIKYLDEQLSTGELKGFETRLEVDVQLKSDLLKFKKKYENSKSHPSVDERYFDTLIPNVKSKNLVSQKKRYLKFAFALPIVIMIIFLVNSSLNDNSPNFIVQDNFEEFTSSDELTTELLSNVLNMDEYYMLDESLINELYSEELDLDESIFEYLENNIHLVDDSDNLIEGLSDDEFSTIYKELKDKNIL